MNHDHLQELWLQAKANRERLDGCSKHFFDLGAPPFSFGAKCACQRCGGVMDLTLINEYARGYAAAGGNPNDVVANYR